MRAMDEQAEMERRSGDLLRYATVDSVDLDAAKVVVALGEKRLGPLDWFMPRSGETTVWSPPSVGEQGLLLCPEGDARGAVFLPGVRSSRHAVPTGDARALVLTFGDGARIDYDAAAHLLTAELPDGGRVELTAPGGVLITADVEIQGDVTASGDVKAGPISLRHHTHGQVQGGSGVSGQPVAP